MNIIRKIVYPIGDYPILGTDVDHKEFIRTVIQLRMTRITVENDFLMAINFIFSLLDKIRLTSISKVMLMILQILFFLIVVSSLINLMIGCKEGSF